MAASGLDGVWPYCVTLAEVSRGPVTKKLKADEAQCKAVAKQLGLAGLDFLEAEVTLTPWFDGAEIKGRFWADVVQTCSLTAEPLPASLSERFKLRVLPPDSPNAPAEESPDELEIDVESDDPPDVLETETVDVSAYVVEHLALALDPFPRKAGAVFVQPPEPVELSPFAALKALKPSSDE